MAAGAMARPIATTAGTLTVRSANEEVLRMSKASAFRTTTLFGGALIAALLSFAFTSTTRAAEDYCVELYYENCVASTGQCGSCQQFCSSLPGPTSCVVEFADCSADENYCSEPNAVYSACSCEPAS